MDQVTENQIVAFQDQAMETKPENGTIMPGCSPRDNEIVNTQDHNIGGEDNEYESDSTEDDTNEYCFSLKDYLRDARFPTFLWQGEEFLSGARQLGHAPDWPDYAELHRDPGTRTLKEVVGCGIMEFAPPVMLYMLRLSDVIVDMDEDKETTELLENDEQFIQLLERFVLNTVSEVARIQHRIIPSSPLADTIKFNHSNNLLHVTDPRWHIFTLPPDSFSLIPLTIVFIKPWEFGLFDFGEFSKAKTFWNGRLDNLEAQPQMRASDTIWAVLYDICKGHGHFFVVTNYLFWIFGCFNKDHTIVKVTPVLHARIMDFDNVSPPVPYLGASVVETLFFWMQNARGAVLDGR